MPRFHFNVHDGVSPPDTDGAEFATLEAACNEAVCFAGDALRERPQALWLEREWRLEVTDERGLVLLSVLVVASLSPAARL
jgi:hypothetical protein